MYASDFLLFSTFRIDSNIGTGTGFFFRIDERAFLVTNKHNIQNTEYTKITFHSKKNKTKKATLKINNIEIEDVWYFEKKYDIAIAEFKTIVKGRNGIDKRINTFAFSPINLLNGNDLSQIQTYEQIIFIGYPNSLWDSKNIFPIIRSGFTSTSIRRDYMNQKKFLIDASCFPGSSGSPVVLYNKELFNSNIGVNVIRGLKLLGILSYSLLFDKSKSKIINKSKFDTLKRVSENIDEIKGKLDNIENLIFINIGMVIKTSEIINLINNYIMKEQQN